MCWIITIAVPAADSEAVRAAHAREGLRIDVTSNPAAIAAAGPDRAPMLVTLGGCSCALYTPPVSVQRDAHVARARAKYERLGWSRAKIERALAAMPRGDRPGDGLNPVAIDLLRRIAAECGAVSVWVHDFRGKAAREVYAIAHREAWRAADLDRLGPTLRPGTVVAISP